MRSAGTQPGQSAWLPARPGSSVRNVNLPARAPAARIAAAGRESAPVNSVSPATSGGTGDIGSQCLSRRTVPATAIWYRNNVRAWLNARQGTPYGRRPSKPPLDITAVTGAGGFVDLKLDHHSKDGIEIVDVEGEIDVYTAPRLRELLIELVNNRFYQLVVNMEKVEFLDSTGLGVLVGGLKRVRAHDGSLDLVCTQERILKIFRITGLTKVFGIHDTVDEAITARRAEK
jgi:anti-sigma B factor antagonist